MLSISISNIMITENNIYNNKSGINHFLKFGWLKITFHDKINKNSIITNTSTNIYI